MKEAHVAAVMTLGVPCGLNSPYDFGRQHITKEVEDVIPIMAKVST